MHGYINYIPYIFNIAIREHYIYIWLFNIAMENPLYMVVLIGKSSINGPFSMAMLNYQRVIYIKSHENPIEPSLNQHFPMNK